jgi:YgiT-type zinc finger domain-containing protein
MKTTRTKRIGNWQMPPECVACGAEDSYVKARTTTEKVCHGETFRVEHAHWKCEQCGTGILGPEEANEAVRATVSAYRSKHGLLTPEDLRNARSTKI